MSTLPPQFTPAHPFAEIFALHDGQPLDDLAARIKKNGLREPIVLFEDKVLDGRRRERACRKAGVEPRYRQFGSQGADGDDPLEFVIDLNLHRRHLGEGERQLAAARYATARVGGDRKPSSHFATMETASGAPTNAQAAERFDITESAVDRAKKVLKHGTPALVRAVAEEAVTISDAQKVTKESPTAQDQAVKDVSSGKAKTLAQAVEQRKPREPGDDTETEAAAKATERAARRANGKPVFDDRKITEAIRKMTCLFNDRANAFGGQKSAAWAAVREKMNALLEAWESWRKREAK